MGILNWIKSVFKSQPIVRDVSNIVSRGDTADGEAIREVVDSGGGTLKPHHRRIVIRDARLLPKPQAKNRPWGTPKTKYMKSGEANRLFSETVRTRDRNVRDFLADEAQLSRYGLPIWKTDEELAAALGITLGQLHHYSIHRRRETSPHYVTFAIKKRSGGERIIHAPKRKLKAIQRKLNELLVDKLPVSTKAHGFRRGHSIATNAECHVGKQVVIKLDIKDCFPSIHFARVRGLLIALGYSYPVATTLAVLTTEPPRQPTLVDEKIYHVPVGPRACVQGAPTSPGLCNAVLLKLDHRLTGLAMKFDFSYTRYADDLTFSGADAKDIKRFIRWARQIVTEEGFSLNRDKIRVIRKSRRQQVTGVVVNQVAGLSRKERRLLRAAIHNMNKNGKCSLTPAQLQGKIAYLKMLNSQQADALMRKIT